MLGEVTIEVEDIRSRLDDQLIREAYPLTAYTGTITRGRTDVLKALEERVLDGVGRLEVEVIGEGHLCIDTTDTTQRTELSRDVLWVKHLEGIISPLHRSRILIVGAIGILHRLVRSRDDAHNHRLRERDATTLTRIISTAFLRSVGDLPLEGEGEPLISLVVEVQQSRVALKAPEGGYPSDIIVPQRREVAQGIITPRSREADIIQSARTSEEDLTPLRSRLTALDEQTCRSYSFIGVFTFELLAQLSTLSILGACRKQRISLEELVVNQSFSLVVKRFRSIHQLIRIGSDTGEARVCLEGKLRLPLLTTLGRDQHDPISSTRAVERSRSRILEYRDRLDIFGVD